MLTEKEIAVLEHLINAGASLDANPYEDIDELTKLIYSQEIIEANSKKKKGVPHIRTMTVSYLGRMKAKGLIEHTVIKGEDSEGMPYYEIIGYRYTKKGKLDYEFYKK